MLEEGLSTMWWPLSSCIVNQYYNISIYLCIYLYYIILKAWALTLPSKPRKWTTIHYYITPFHQNCWHVTPTVFSNFTNYLHPFLIVFLPQISHFPTIATPHLLSLPISKMNPTISQFPLLKIDRDEKLN